MTYKCMAQLSYYTDKKVFVCIILKPSVEILKTWISSVSYQAAHKPPQLPLLKKESRSKLSLVFDCQPLKMDYTPITFFDRYGDILEKKVEKVRDFIYLHPEDSYILQVSLLSMLDLSP